MAKTSTKAKRKSESALPTGKSKRKKTSHQLSDFDETGPSGHSSDELFVRDAKPVKKSGPKARKSEPVVRRDEEYEEDVGRMESQQFLSLVKTVELSKKGKRKAAEESAEWVKAFKAQAKGEADVLNKKIEEGIAASTKTDADFIGKIRAAYEVAAPFTTVSVSSKDKEEGDEKESGFGALYKRSQELTQSAHDLVSKFEEVTKNINELNTGGLLRENEWGEMDGKMVHLLSVGMKIGVERVQGILKVEREERGLDLGEEDKRQAESVLFKVGDGEEEMASVWGRMARKQIKIMGKSVRGLVVGAA